MEKIKEIVNELNRVDKNWTFSFTDQKDNIKENDSLLRYLNDLIKILRELYKETSEPDLGELKELISNDEAYEGILKYTKFSLKKYFALVPLREMETEDEIEIKQFLFDVMENYIVRYDNTFQLKYQRYSFENQQQYEEVLSSLDSLVLYYVKKQFAFETIVHELKDDTGISESVCRYFAKLIEDNYQKIQLNLLINMLDIQEERIESYMSKNN